jgi:hypothetical protein
MKTLTRVLAVVCLFAVPALAQFSWKPPNAGADGGCLVTLSGHWVRGSCSSSAGTVTHTAGSLTANKMVVGNGSSDVTVDGNISTDGTGNLSATSFTSTSSGVNGSLSMAGGTSGTATIRVGAVAGSPTWTLPAANTDGWWRESGGVISSSIIADTDLPATTTTVTTACGTAAHCAVGASPKQAMFFNQQATAGTAVFYDLPQVADTVVGMTYCFKNSDVAGTARTGAITITPPSGAYIHVDGTRLTVSHGLSSTGAAGDSACFVAINVTTQVDWEAYIYRGSWATN